MTLPNVTGQLNRRQHAWREFTSQQNNLKAKDMRFNCGFYGALMFGARKQMNFPGWDSKVDVNLNIYNKQKTVAYAIFHRNTTVIVQPCH